MEIQHLLILVWVTFALMTGIAEAFYFNKNQRDVELWGEDIHYWLTASRMIVATPIVVIITIDTWFVEGWLISFKVLLIFSAILILSFPFFHDGVYYTVREILKKGTYPNMIFAQSKHTSAKFSFNAYWRIVFLIIALLIFPY